MRLTVLALARALALGAILVACTSEPLPPNVLLITLDTTRPDFFSTYGGTNPTPGIDALARSGVRFDAALATSAVTPVSHASILTGRYQYEHGLRVLSAGSGFRLPASQPTLASHLKAAGYATAAIHSAFPVSGYFGLDQGFDRFESFDGQMRLQSGQTKTSWDSRSLQRRSDETTAIALDLVQEVRNTGQPFFMWIHYWDPHDPVLLPPREWLSNVQSEPAGNAANSAVYEQVYAAEVRFMDRQIEALMQGLRQQGLYDQTLILLTADHGEGLSDGFRRHGWGKHRMLYQEQIHVPLILSGPGLPTGKVISELVSSVDIAPTLLDLLDLPEPGTSGAPFSGRSLRPLLEGGSLPAGVAYADQVNGYDYNASMIGQRPDAAFLYSVCDGQWKLIYRPHMPQRSELFNLVQDPGEIHNRIADEPQVYLRLMEDLAQRNPWVLEPFPDDGSADLPGAAQALRALGYGGDEAGSGEEAQPLWWWTCPAHPDYRRGLRADGAGGAQHEPGSCPRPVVPATDWDTLAGHR